MKLGLSKNMVESLYSDLNAGHRKQIIQNEKVQAPKNKEALIPILFTMAVEKILNTAKNKYNMAIE